MKILMPIILAVVLATVLGALPGAPSAPGPIAARSAPAPEAGDPPVCETISRMVLDTASHEAQADYWLQVARCLNSSGGERLACMQDALVERQEALALAREQFDARQEICEELGHGPYQPAIDPASFSPDIINPWLPFTPGRTLIYEQQTPEGLERVEVTTLNQVVVVAGIPCRVVRDVVYLDGAVVEDTFDWYSQHTSGDVWYTGEIAKNYEDGFLDNVDGSWRTGKDQAQPGILMPGNPVIGQLHRQEYLIGEAEDVARVVRMGETVTVPAGTFHDCVVTLEWTPIEPDTFAEKFYAQGIGAVLEVDLETGERLELVQIQ